jgi:uncharacterized protein (TIGR00725 family)
MARPFVGVMGSGSVEFAEMAEPLGRWIADQGYDLLTGGGGGVMAAACRGFASVPNRRGVSVGVLPAGPPAGYPNPWVDLVIQTHLPKRGNEGADILSRNHINVLSAGVVVVLPGREGTQSELALAVHYRKPVIAFLGPEGKIGNTLRVAIQDKALKLEEVTAFVQRHMTA